MIHGIVTRGTTPTQIFELPFSTEELEDVTITYALNNEIIVRRRSRDCVFENNYIIIELSQMDTMLFPAGKIIEVQLKVLTKSDKVFASSKYRLQIDEIFDREEMRKWDALIHQQSSFLR